MSPEQKDNTPAPTDFNEIVISQTKNELVSDYNSGSFRHFDNLHSLIREAILKSFEQNRYFCFEVQCTGTKNGNKKVKQIVRAVIKKTYETLYECYFNQQEDLRFIPVEKIDTIKLNFTPVHVCVKNIKTDEENSKYLWD